MRILFLFAAFCSYVCMQMKPKNIHVKTVEVYGFALTAHTKLAIDTVMVKIATPHLFNVKNPDVFYNRVYNIIKSCQSIEQNKFKWNLTRMNFKIIFQNGTCSNIFIDKGGEHILINNKTYYVNKSISKLITESLPLDNDKKSLVDSTGTYKRKNYIPVAN